MRAAAAGGGAARLDGPVVDLAADLLGDRRGDDLGRRRLEVHAAARAVAPEPVPHVGVLLEVVAEREVEERPAVGGQLHRRGQASLHDGEVAGGQVPVEVGHEGPDLQPVVRGQRRRIDPRAGDDDHPQPGHVPPGLGEGGHDALEQRAADARSAHRHHAHLLGRRVAELRAQPLAVGELGRVEARDVAGEVEVLPGPVGDRRQVGPERVGDDVLQVADEDRAVAHPRVARDVLDHLGVVVGGEHRLVLAAVGHRQPADEVGQPRVGGALLLGVLVQVVVDLPALVGDPQVVVGLADEVVEDHEVGDQDLVHAPPRLEAVQVVLGRLGLDVDATRWRGRGWRGGRARRRPRAPRSPGAARASRSRGRGGGCAARGRSRCRAARGRGRSATRRRARACAATRPRVQLRGAGGER